MLIKWIRIIDLNHLDIYPPHSKVSEISVAIQMNICREKRLPKERIQSVLAAML